jgi:hypothetical protein
VLPCEVDDPAHSLGGHALEAVGGNLLRRMVISVLKDYPNGQACALHQPRARNLAGDPFNVAQAAQSISIRSLMEVLGGINWPIVAGNGGRGGALKPETAASGFTCSEWTPFFVQTRKQTPSMRSS